MNDIIIYKTSIIILIIQQLFESIRLDCVQTIATIEAGHGQRNVGV